MGTLRRVSDPGPALLSLQELRSHLRMSDDGEHDALIMGYGRAAQDLLEGMTGRPLITSTWEWRIDAFPCAWITLPMPAQTIEAITYLDADGADQTLATSGYLHIGDRIFAAYNTRWPSTRLEIGAVVIRFTSGFGDNWNSVPESLRMAALLLVQSWYDLGQVGEELPAAVAALVSPYRLLQAGAA